MSVAEAGTGRRDRCAGVTGWLGRRCRQADTEAKAVPPRRERPYIIATGCLLLGGLLGVVALVWALRSAALVEAREALEQSSTAVAEQLSSQMELVNLTLQDVEHRVEVAAARSGTEPQLLLRQPETHAILHDLARRLLLLDAVSLIDADGWVASTSRDSPPSPVFIGDRDFIRALRDDPALDGFIGEPTVSRIAHVPSVFVARRLGFGTGRFQGVAVGVIPLRSMIASMVLFATAPRIAVTLERMDGTVLARVPEQDRAGGALVAVHNADRGQLRVVVSMRESDALRAWRRQARGILLIAVAVAHSSSKRW